MLNDWNKSQVNRAENSWGQKTPPYSKSMFDAVVKGGDSYLDMGCGFGRFLRYLLTKVEDPDYIGYDSSLAMIDRISENFPFMFPRFFCRNITDPIDHSQQSILISAVLIHLTIQDQQKILTNLTKLTPKPKSICFDINSPNERSLKKLTHFEKIIPPGFRMTWQSHYVMTKQVLSMFPNYDLSTEFYDLKSGRNKVVYKLKLRSE